MADMLGRWLIPRQAGPAPAAAPEPVAAAEASEAALDMAAIGRIRSIAGADGASLLSRVVGQFEATAPPLLATMRAKSRDGDAEAVWRAAHSLKSRQCAQIEALARNDGTLPSDLQLATLADALATATQALHGLVAADGATPAAAPA
jgi:HPt (histidine-containing phosphotransfer) domain-containing protein